MKDITNCNRFEELPIYHISSALYLAENQNDRNIVEHIKNSNRFQEIPIEQLGIALENYVHNKYD